MDDALTAFAVVAVLACMLISFAYAISRACPDSTDNRKHEEEYERFKQERLKEALDAIEAAAPDFTGFDHASDRKKLWVAMMYEASRADPKKHDLQVEWSCSIDTKTCPLCMARDELRVPLKTAQKILVSPEPLCLSPGQCRCNLTTHLVRK